MKARIPFPEGITGLPEGRTLHFKKAKHSPHDSVIEIIYKKKGGPEKTSAKVVGKIVGGRYVPAEEYQKLYTRAGTPLSQRPEENAKHETRHRAAPGPGAKKPGRKRLHPAPNPDKVVNYPRGVKGATVSVKAGTAWVIVNRSFRDKGKLYHRSEYIGRIENGRYYTLEEYRSLFKPKRGRPKKSEGKA